MSDLPTLFVSGASGHLGRRVIELLSERGHAGELIAGSRTPEKAVFPGVETRHADFDDVSGLTAALGGVDRMLLISTDILDAHRIVLHTNAVKAAKAAGVKRIIYTSMINPGPESPIPFWRDHYDTEQAIKQSGIDHTILRVSWYAENLVSSLPQNLASGKWFSAAGEGRVAHVPREDAARAAAGALLAGGPSRTLDVTGPAALTTSEIAAIATEVTGKPIEVVDLTEEQLAEGLHKAGVPDGVINGFILPFERNTRLGRIDSATDAVEQLWGTKPQTLKDFLTANKAALLG
ncbi:MAG TPA: NAD(P)H-binding protein [Devosia sp.]|nr:NAD(P)H-binding protein [Devosia sp.]